MILLHDIIVVLNFLKGGVTLVSERIKKLRVNKGLTQEQLGEILGVGKATVQKYESGQIQNLKSAHIKKLCDLFGKKPHYFIFDDLEKYKHNDNDIFEKIESTHGEIFAQILKQSLTLNEKGLKMLLQCAIDLNEIERYKKR